MKELVIKIIGESELMLKCVDTFCIATGWTEESILTKEQHIQKTLGGYFSSTIQNYSQTQLETYLLQQQSDNQKVLSSINLGVEIKDL